MTNRPKLIAILGPTASGKTDLSLELARRFGGEIVNCDTRQFYRDIPIGAATAPGRRVKRGRRRVWLAEGVPHYLINFLSPRRQMTVAEYQARAVWRLREIARRGKVPMLVGGSMLFAAAVIDNYQMPEVPPDEAFRRRMEKVSLDKLGEKLAAMDPAYAERIGPNRRYIVRALEVMRATGRTVTELQRKGEPIFDTLLIGVTRPKAELDERINRRFDFMMKAGLLEETAQLGRYYGWDCPAAMSLGHRQLGTCLRGEMPLDEAVAEAKRATRAYAKRQMTWFRRDRRIRWVKTGDEATSLVAAHLQKVSGTFCGVGG
jgi:tRNA dimethylallyltransferase